jgi:PAS domain S-box-containing protein
MNLPLDNLTENARARVAAGKPHRPALPTRETNPRAGPAKDSVNDTTGLTGDPFPVLVDALPVIVWMTDEQGNTIQVNQAGFAFSGVTPEQISGYGWRPLVHVDDLPGYEKAYREALAARRGFNLDCRIRRTDGAYRWLLNTGVPRLTPDGEFLGYTGCSIDITDRKEAEARLHAEVAQRRHNEQVSCAQKGALVRTLSGLAANPTLDAYLGEVLKALAEQLDESEAGLWLIESDEVVRLHINYQNGQVLRADQTDHPGAGPVPPNVRYLRGLAYQPHMFDVANDPALTEYRPYLLARGVRGILIVPMFFGDESIGAFSVRSTRRTSFPPEEVELAQTLAHQATLAIQLTRLAEKERESAERQRRELEARVLGRTLELNRAVEALNAEVVERQLTARVSRGQTDALTRTLCLLAGEPDLDTFLGHVLTTITRQLDAPSSTFWFYDAARHEFELHMSSDRGHISIGTIVGGEDELPTRFDDSPPDFQEVLATRRPVLQNDVANNPRITEHREWLVSHGIRSIMLVPVTLGDTMLGLIIVGNTRSDYWQPEETELAQALAHQASLAVQLTRLAQRSRMAREIHDTLAQSFTGIVIHQEAAKRILPESVADARQHITRTLELARTGLAEARRSVGRLRSEVLDARPASGRDDLPASLSRLMEQMTADTGVRGDVVLEGEKRPLADAVRAQLLRIGQEALTNALRHGQPSHVRVELTYEPDSVRLRIWDDGRGFDLSAVDANGGFGLIGMRERAEQVAGRLLVTSHPHGGTEVIVSVQT